MLGILQTLAERRDQLYYLCFSVREAMLGSRPPAVIASVGRSGRLTIYSVWLVLVWDPLQITKFTHGTRTLVLLARGSADCPALLFRLSYFVFVWCIAVSHFFYGDVMVKGTQI